MCYKDVLSRVTDTAFPSSSFIRIFNGGIQHCTVKENCQRECMQRTQALQAFYVCTLGDDLVDLPKLRVKGFSDI